jgi:capsular exopolysaccharide synthesis family protein
MNETLRVDRNPPQPKVMLRPIGFGAEPGAAQDGLDLREIFGVLRRRANLILGCMLIGTVISTIVVLQLTPRYTAEATVMLDTRKNQMVDFASVVAGLQGDAIVVRSEVEILQSRALAAKVADKLNIDAIPEFNPSLAKPGPFEPLLHPIQWVARRLKHISGAPTEAAGDAEAAERDRKSREVRALMGRVTIANDGKSYLISIRAQSEDRALAAKIANAYVDFYLLDQIEAKFDAIHRASIWLNDQLSDLRDKARNSDRAVQLFKEQNNLTEAKGATLTEQQLSELNSQLIVAGADRAQKEASLRQLQDQIRAGSIDAAAVLDSPLVQKLRSDEAGLQHQLAEDSARYKPSHPTMVNLRAEIDDVKRKIDDEANKTVRGLQGEVNAARAKENALRETLDGLRKDTAHEGKLDVQLHELERDADANKLVYESFLNKFKQTTTQEDFQQADARLVSSALEPTVPSYPNKVMFVGFAFMISIFVGILLAFLLERLDNGFRGSEQIEKILGLSTLGLVPNIIRQELPQDLVVKRPTSQYSEAIRSIRTALRYSDIDHPPKVVLVTSSLQSEGKTVFATSLARSVARSGGKSLLVDCDLRRPSIAKLMVTDAEPGLLDVFSEGANVESIIRVDEGSGMHYIPSKSGTANPQDILGSQHMRSFLERMSAVYDLIVLDAPPVLAVSDPIILSHFVDTTLYLVRWEKTPRPVVSGAMKLLAANGGPVAGVVLSRVDSRKHSTYGYGDAVYYYGRHSNYYG